MDAVRLILRFRAEVKDTREPFFWTGEQLLGWLDEAQREAAIRGRLLHASVARQVVVSDPDEPAFCECGGIYEITRAEIAERNGRRRPLKLASSEWLDRECPDWRERREPPRWLVQYDNALRLAPAPPGRHRVFLEGFRFPLPIKETGGEPEIHPAHHERLLDWVAFRAFSVHDADAFDPGRADRAQAEFSRYFGLPVDCGLRRETRMDAPHHNEPFMV